MFRSFRNRFRANSSTSEEEAQPVHEDAVVEVEEDERGSDEIGGGDSSESQDGDNRVHVEYYTHEDRVWRPAVLVIHAGAHGVRVYLRTEGGEVRIALGDDWSREVVGGDGARAAFVVRAGDETTVVRARDGNATLRVFARLNAVRIDAIRAKHAVALEGRNRVALEDVERSVEEAQDYSLKAAARTGDRARVAWMRRVVSGASRYNRDCYGRALLRWALGAGVTVTSTNTNLPELNPASHREKRRAAAVKRFASVVDGWTLKIIQRLFGRWRTRAEVSTSAARRDADHVQSLREAVDYTHRVMAKQASAAIDTLRGFEDTRLRLAEQHASELDEWRAAARRATAHEGELEDELARRQADADARVADRVADLERRLAADRDRDVARAEAEADARREAALAAARGTTRPSWPPRATATASATARL
ncbi:hypothetical protein JL721_318 [Aureococcus anophagefferens]|nr:hypothetical protein JL721_318 [Aureococcus anophagefferens]